MPPQSSGVRPTAAALFGPTTKDLYGYWYGKWYEVEARASLTAEGTPPDRVPGVEEVD